MANHYGKPLVIAGSVADLLVSIPVAYYFLLIRPGVQPLLTIIPVFLGGLLRVSYLVPLAGWWKFCAGAICEIGLLYFLARKGKSSLAARILVSEFSILQLALTGFWPTREVAFEGEAFTIHRESGATLILRCLAGISFIEAVCVHLAVHNWSARVAWGLTAVSVYGALFLLALARGFELRPLVVTSDGILFRAGLLWGASVKRASVSTIERVSGCDNELSRLRIAMFAEPNVLITFGDDQRAEGLYGRTKIIRQIAISLDQPDNFIKALTPER